MAYDIIPFIIIIVSFLLIIIIIGRKIPALRVLDVETIIEEKELKIKKKLIESRLKRNVERFKHSLAFLAKPAVKGILDSFRGFYKRVIELEIKYKTEGKQKAEGQLDPQVRLSKYLDEAHLLMKDENAYPNAEELFMKALEIDMKNLDAYRGLGDLYRLTKDYPKAKETFKYLIRLYADRIKKGETELKHDQAESYAYLGEIEQFLDNKRAAMRNLKKAVEQEPNNPKFLDLLLNFSIIVKDKKLSQATLDQLKQADPGNQKLAELDKEVKSL